MTVKKFNMHHTLALKRRGNTSGMVRIRVEFKVSLLGPSVLYTMAVCWCLTVWNFG